jgi:hypothetical protein
LPIWTYQESANSIDGGGKVNLSGLVESGPSGFFFVVFRSETPFHFCGSASILFPVEAVRRFWTHERNQKRMKRCGKEIKKQKAEKSRIPIEDF